MRGELMRTRETTREAQVLNELMNELIDYFMRDDARGAGTRVHRAGARKRRQHTPHAHMAGLARTRGETAEGATSRHRPDTHTQTHTHTPLTHPRALGLALSMPWGSCLLDEKLRGVAWPLPQHLVCVEKFT